MGSDVKLDAAGLEAARVAVRKALGPANGRTQAIAEEVVGAYLAVTASPAEPVAYRWRYAGDKVEWTGLSFEPIVDGPDRVERGTARVSEPLYAAPPSIRAETLREAIEKMQSAVDRHMAQWGRAFPVDDDLNHGIAAILALIDTPMKGEGEHEKSNVWPDFAAPQTYDNAAEGLTDPRLPNFRLIWHTARGLGYAVGLHGSMKRDCDLIAVPWVEAPATPQALIDAICSALNAREVGPRDPKPNGRIAVNLQIDGWFKLIDLSIVATLPAHNGDVLRAAARVAVGVLNTVVVIGTETSEGADGPHHSYTPLATQALDAWRALTDALAAAPQSPYGEAKVDGWVLIKRGAFWRPNSQGYTNNLAEAGIYTDEESAARCANPDVTRELYEDAKARIRSALA